MRIKQVMIDLTKFISTLIKNSFSGPMWYVYTSISRGSLKWEIFIFPLNLITLVNKNFKVLGTNTIERERL